MKKNGGSQPMERQGPVRVGGGLDLLEQVFPGAVRRPQPMALVHGLPRAEPLGKVAPVRPGPDPVENPVDHLSVITPPSAPPIADRQKRPQLLPLSVCKITPPHARTTSRTAQSHTIDRTGSSCWPTVLAAVESGHSQIFGNSTPRVQTSLPLAGIPNAPKVGHLTGSSLCLRSL